MNLILTFINLVKWVLRKEIVRKIDVFESGKRVGELTWGNSGSKIIEIKHINVIESERKKGHGTRLIKKLETKFKKAECIYVLSSPEVGAKTFYLKNSFEEISQAQKFLGDRHVLFMKKPLGGLPPLIKNGDN